jgi:hypothetical protein
LGNPQVSVCTEVLALRRALRLSRAGEAIVWKDTEGVLPPLRLQIHSVVVMWGRRDALRKPRRFGPVGT